jgi:hypothetical protein
MPLDLEKFTDKEIMNIVVYGFPNNKCKCLFWGPLRILPCNLCGWTVDFHPTDFMMMIKLYAYGAGCLCQGCQMNFFWELEMRNLSLNIGKVVFE